MRDEVISDDFSEDSVEESQWAARLDVEKSEAFNKLPDDGFNKVVGVF